LKDVALDEFYVFLWRKLNEQFPGLQKIVLLVDELMSYGAGYSEEKENKETIMMLQCLTMLIGLGPQCAAVVTSLSKKPFFEYTSDSRRKFLPIRLFSLNLRNESTLELMSKESFSSVWPRSIKNKKNNEDPKFESTTKTIKNLLAVDRVTEWQKTNHLFQK
jgi:hypothetical protein